VAIFDLSGWERDLPIEKMAPYAVANYELGIAFALGRPVMIIASQGQSLPFDIDIEPVRLFGDDDDAARLMQALDEILYGVQRVSGESSLVNTLQYIENRYVSHPASQVRTLAKSIVDAERPNPQLVSRQYTAMRSYIGNEAQIAIYPTWPGDYPELHERRCFHITAFRRWTGQTTRLVQAACKQAGVGYVRGDQQLTPDIIRSVWAEICQASYIVTDLTGLNPNAALELGIAHALGRNVILISQDRKLGVHFRAIEKERVHYYSLADEAGSEEMQAALAKFLTE
jgi:nucleoside 2-deoxyribosyltransferase